MHRWRDLIGSLVASVGSLVVLAKFPDGAIDVATGVALVTALALLARSAIRLAADPERGDAPAPPPHG